MPNVYFTGLSIEEREQAIQTADWFMSQLTAEQREHISKMIPVEDIQEIAIVKLAEISSRRGLNYILQRDHYQEVLGSDNFDWGPGSPYYDQNRLSLYRKI
ncbi:hypothetical protein [Paenibacillus sp. BAC0078]